MGVHVFPEQFSNLGYNFVRQLGTNSVMRKALDSRK